MITLIPRCAVFYSEILRGTIPECKRRDKSIDGRNERTRAQSRRDPYPGLPAEGQKKRRDAYLHEPLDSTERYSGRATFPEESKADQDARRQEYLEYHHHHDQVMYGKIPKDGETLEDAKERGQNTRDERNANNRIKRSGMTPAEKLRVSRHQCGIEPSDGDSEESLKEHREKSKRGQRDRNAKKKKAER